MFTSLLVNSDFIFPSKFSHWLISPVTIPLTIWLQQPSLWIRLASLCESIFSEWFWFRMGQAWSWRHSIATFAEDGGYCVSMVRFNPWKCKVSNYSSINEKMIHPRDLGIRTISKGRNKGKGRIVCAHSQFHYIWIKIIHLETFYSKQLIRCNEIDYVHIQSCLYLYFCLF